MCSDIILFNLCHTYVHHMYTIRKPCLLTLLLLQTLSDPSRPLQTTLGLIISCYVTSQSYVFSLSLQTNNNYYLYLILSVLTKICLLFCVITYYLIQTLLDSLFTQKSSVTVSLCNLPTQRNDNNPSDPVQLRNSLLRNNSLSNSIRIVVSKAVNG